MIYINFLRTSVVPVELLTTTTKNFEYKNLLMSYYLILLDTKERAIKKKLSLLQNNKNVMLYLEKKHLVVYYKGKSHDSFAMEEFICFNYVC